MPTTPRGFRYPDSGDPPDVPTDMEELALDIDAQFSMGTLGARPAADVEGRWYLATDTAQLFVDTGSVWFEIPMGGGQRQITGDLKYGLQTADHEGWLKCDGRGTLLRADYEDLSDLLVPILGAPDSTHFYLPDYQGRVLVGLGTNGEVNSLADNDGLAVGSRKPRHRHGRGTLAADAAAVGNHDHQSSYEDVPQLLAAGGGGGSHWAYGSGDVNIADIYIVADTTSQNGAHDHAVTLSGEIGDTAGPLDGPAFGVASVFVKY